MAAAAVHPWQVMGFEIWKPPQMEMHTVDKRLEWSTGCKWTEAMGSTDVSAVVQSTTADVVQYPTVTEYRHGQVEGISQCNGPSVCSQKKILGNLGL